MKLMKSAALELVKLCCRVLDDKKAGEIAVLDVSAQSSITDYLVIATATSEPHLRALRVELEKAIDAAQVRLIGMEARQESGWLVMDAFDVMIHLFLPRIRERFGLERLWQDATGLSVRELLQIKSIKAVAKKTRRSPLRNAVAKAKKKVSAGVKKKPSRPRNRE